MYIRILNTVLLTMAGLMLLLVPMINDHQQSHTETIKAQGGNFVSYKVNADELRRDSVTITILEHDDELFYLTMMMGKNRQSRLTFVLMDQNVKAGTYVLDDPTKRYLLLSTDSSSCNYTSDEYFNGMLTIHDYDKSMRSISGTFEFVAMSQACENFVKMTDGKFDVQFR